MRGCNLHAKMSVFVSRPSTVDPFGKARALFGARVRIASDSCANDLTFEQSMGYAVRIERTGTP